MIAEFYGLIFLYLKNYMIFLEVSLINECFGKHTQRVKNNLSETKIKILRKMLFRFYFLIFSRGKWFLFQ